MGTKVAAVAVAMSLVAIVGVPGSATPGDLDPDFAGDGITTTPIGESTDFPYGVAVQPDGKIVVAGFTFPQDGTGADFALARFNIDGTLDASFSGDGIVVTPSPGANGIQDVVLQSDGKIVVAGFASSTKTVFALARYNADGSPDTSFSDDGFQTTVFDDNAVAYALALQSDGKIVAAGFSSLGNDASFAVARYDASGSLDASFSDDGVVTTSIGTSGQEFALDVAIQPDGEVLAAGVTGTGPSEQFALVRYTSNGVLDPSFSNDGIVTTAVGSSSAAHAVAVLADNKIIAAGYSQAASQPSDFALVRYNSNGSLDPGFSGDGVVTTSIGSNNDAAYDLAIQPDGKIILAGDSYGTQYRFALARYTRSGSLDTSFSNDGMLTTMIGSDAAGATGVAWEPDGHIIVAGYAYFPHPSVPDSDIAVARYFAGPLQTFDDVAPNYWAFDEIETLAKSGVTGGCSYSPPLFCPDSPVSRAQMAVFLVRAMGEEGNLPSFRGYFDDVPAGQWYTGYVERLYELGVTAGCGSQRYCPASRVTREQMAVFILRSIGHAGHLVAYRGIFSDVPSTNPYSLFIEHLYDHGITTGCAANPRRYCPGLPVSRAQMAVFLAHAFAL